MPVLEEKEVNRTIEHCSFLSWADNQTPINKSGNKRGGKMVKRLTHNLRRNEKGITGLETAIILIAFVVVAAVFAYTVLSAGLFATQKSQQAVYAGLQEAQSTLELKGSVVINGRAELDDCDYPAGWSYDAEVALTRETTAANVQQGSASMKLVIEDADVVASDEVVWHAMEAVDFTAGDTISFFIKSDPAITSGNLTFYLDTDADFTGGSTESANVGTTGTNWEKKTITLSGADDDSSVYYGLGIPAGADYVGTVYLDNFKIDSVAAYGGMAVSLDNCDYPTAWGKNGANLTVTRDTTSGNYTEGNGSMKVVCAAGAAAGDEAYHAMKAKTWTATDNVSFWVKTSVATTDNLTFHFASAADLSGNSLDSVDVGATVANTWKKVSFDATSAGAATYYGVALKGAVTGTFWVDGIECDASLNANDDPMLPYGSEVVFTVSNVLNGEPINFTITSDADNDGIISDETTKNHKVVIAYSDANQQVSDIAWYKTAIGKSDGDALLENSEKFQITVDLTYVNNNAGLDYKKLGKSAIMNLEVKPAHGAVLIIERTMPVRIQSVNNMN
jgi:flagellin-like protein